MGRLQLRLLGGFQARVGDGPPLTLATRKVQALLAYLALPPGQAQPRDKLAALLWGERGEEQARHSLRQRLSDLRKALAEVHPPPLRIDGESVALDPAAVEVDVAAFERLVAAGTPASLDAATARYQGDLLAGLGPMEAPFEEWLLGERERLRELALEALAKLLRHHAQAGALEPATQTALRLLALDPWQEAVHRALMRLYAEQGRRGMALKQYQLCVSALQRDLGTEPEAETKQLYQAILRGPGAEPRKGEPLATRPARESPLIGRGAELSRLREALAEGARGRGQVVLVLGEAGIGKTRLLEELAAEAEARGARVLLGRAYESEQILPFGPWVDAIRTGKVLAETEVLQALGPAWRAELTRLFPELAGPGLPPGTGDLRRLFEAVAELVSLLAARQPLLLLLEDLHWADEMSLRLLAFLGHRAQAWCAAFVATARAEELVDARALGRTLDELRRMPECIDLTLEALSRSDTEALVRTLAQAGTDESHLARLGEQVWTVSEGNPFVAVEAMRALQEGDAPPAAARLAVPQRVWELIAGRLDRVGERLRGLVGVAAVIGRAFDFALLARAAGWPDPEAAEGVEELVRRRILHTLGERLDFTHDRIREVAYGQLLPPRRRLLHGQVARVIEARYAPHLEPHAAALAHHYREAEAWDKAVVFLHQAGRQAGARSAHREAVSYFEQALAALRSLPQTRQLLEQAIDLRLDLRNSLLPLGEYGRILQHLRHAEGVAETLGDQRRLGQVSMYVARYFWVVGDQDRALESGQRALALAEAIGDFASRFMATFHLGTTCLVSGDYRRAAEFLAQNVASLEGERRYERFALAGLPSVVSRAWLVWCLAELGGFAEAIARGDEAIRIAEAVDHPYSVIFAHRGLGLVYLRKGDLPKAIAPLERGVALCRAAGIPDLFPGVAAFLGSAYAISGRAGEALALLEQAVSQAAAMRLAWGHSLWLTLLGEASLLADRPPEAVALVRRGLELSRQHKERGHQAWALRLRGEIAAHRDPPDAEQAEASYRQALALTEELGMRPLQAHCHLGLGKLYSKVGRPGEARSELSTAIDMYRAMEMTFWLPEAEPALATVT
jgi:DNA-binding SARP family transcriptional activator